MMRSLDALGWFKWPSLLLVASPLAAYPFWVPKAPRTSDCGLVTLKGRLFHAFRAQDGGTFVLRPTPVKGVASAVLDEALPTGFDSGAMIVSSDNSGLGALRCRDR